MNKTGIEYLTHTWNPIAMRCTRVSPACDNCWHLQVADRLSLNPLIRRDKRMAYAGDGAIVYDREKLMAPIRRKKPAIIGVQFMGDLFHSSISMGLINEIFEIMKQAHWHTFIVLTKRIVRALNLCGVSRAPWPKNIIAGTTAEDQKRFDERVPHLLKIPAATKLVSIEPMLEEMFIDRLRVGFGSDIAGMPPQHDFIDPLRHISGLDWVICGGEQGPRATNPDHVRSLRDQCIDSGTPFMFKQWGSFCAPNQMPPETFSQWEYHHGTEGWNRDEWDRFKMGKKRAGRMLDGEEWVKFPEILKGRIGGRQI